MCGSEGAALGVLRGFLLMAGMFSLNHGAAVACLSFAVAELGTRVGNASSGSLYLSFMVTALFLSSAVVARLGAKGGLLLGTSLYASYVLSFVVAAGLARGGANQEDASVWTVAVVGGVLGGVAAGILLTASGAYFSYAARDYAVARGNGCTFEASTTKLSGFMAGIFVGTEVVCKLLASLIVYTTGTWIWMAIVFLGISLLSALGMTRIRSVFASDTLVGNNSQDNSDVSSSSLHYHQDDDCNVMSDRVLLDGQDISPVAEDIIISVGSNNNGSLGNNNNNDDGDKSSVGKGTTSDAAVLRLQHQPQSRLAVTASVLQVLAAWVHDPRLLLAGGVNLAFGLCSAYLTSYLNGIVVKAEYSGSAVGLFAAITPAVSGVSALPFAYFARKVGTKTPFMALASLAAGTVAVLGLALDTSELGALGVLLCLYVLEGWLRCVFEGINKAVFADLFLGQSEVAFATLIVQSGGASALAFWMMSVGVNERFVAAATLIAAVAAMPMFLCAQQMRWAVDIKQFQRNPTSGALSTDRRRRKWGHGGAGDDGDLFGEDQTQYLVS